MPTPVPAFCPECLAAGTLVPCGPGVERLNEEVAARFPEARVALMVSDLLPGPRAAAELADAMAAHRYDVLIGTQIVAKGHHFPMLTLVGVVDADLGLERRRSARRRADLSAAAPGRRPRRARRAAGPRADPDLYARAAGDAGARRRRPRPLSRRRGGGAARRAAAAVRPAGGADRQRRRCRSRRFRRPRARPRRAATAGRDGARPGAGAARDPARPPPPAAFWSRPSARSICRRCCATGWPRCASAGSARLQVDIDPYSFL